MSTPLSVSYHDNLGIEREPIIVGTLTGETLRVQFGYDMNIFIARERLTELRDKITAFLDTSESLAQGSPEGEPPQAEDVNDGGVSDIEKQNDEIAAMVDRREPWF